MDGFFWNIIFNNSNDSGTRENIDTDAITPAANAKDILIILLVFLNGIKIGIIPIKVDRPAIDVTIKENIILFILKFIHNKKKYAKKKNHPLDDS